MATAAIAATTTTATTATTLLSTDAAYVIQTLISTQPKPSAAVSPRSTAAAAAMSALGNIGLLAQLSSDIVRGAGTSTASAAPSIVQPTIQQPAFPVVQQQQHKTVKRRKPNKSELAAASYGDSSYAFSSSSMTAAAKLSKKNMTPLGLEKERQMVLEKNRAAAKAYRKRKRDKESVLRERVVELESQCKLYKQTLSRHGIPDPCMNPVNVPMMYTTTSGNL